MTATRTWGRSLGARGIGNLQRRLIVVEADHGGGAAVRQVRAEDRPHLAIVRLRPAN